MKFFYRSAAVCLGSLIALLADNIEAWELPPPENWMQWRGPSADGQAAGNAKPPIEWNKEKNVTWKIDLPGEGSATPIVFGNQIFILSAVKTDRKSSVAIVNDERAKTIPDEF